MSGTLSRGTCYVKGFSATRVAFFLGSTPLNTDGNVADGMSCILDTRAFPNGTRQLRAVAYDSTGRSYEERISINIQNAGSTPPNTAPTVSLTSPSAGETVTGTLNYAATAYDNAGVSRVEFRLNGGLIATDVTAPYAGTVTAPAAGTHTLTATAYDAAGLSNSSSVTFTVPPATPPINTAPTVSITSPQPGQSVAGTLNFAANATDNSGVARVEFRVDGALVGTDTSAPFTGSVAAPGPGTHTLTATAYDAAGLSATSSVTFSVGQASPVACSPGATSAINVTVQPSRISGIAPLYVFFDATGTTATRTARPFHELEYRWNFGDPASGAWSYGSGQGLSSNNSRNLATGPVAGHVFETAGTYNVCLTANDGTNTASRPVTITVTSPDAAPEFAGMATVCVDSRARPVAGADGCPAGAAVLLSADFDDVINTAARNGATHRRILFRRGSTFTTSTAARLHANGPGLVGAYGTGAKPYINGASAKMSLGSTSNLAFADWRVVDLNFDGQNQTATGGAAFQATGPFRQVTLLRVEARRVLHGVLLSKTFLDQINSTTPFRAPIFSELGIVDSTIEDVYDYGFLGHAHRVSFLGNRFHARTNPATPQNGAGHLIRLAYTNSAVVSHNELGGWAQGNSLTIRGLSNQGDRTIPPDAWTEKVVVSDNTINGGSSVWFFTIRRVNDQLEARFRNILVERNLLVATPPTVTMLATDGGEMTIRNNLLNLTGAATPIGIALGKSNLAPAGVNANVAVYNNTAYSGSSGSGNFRFVSISDAPPNLRVRNNLSYVPNLVGSHVATSGTPGPGAVISHNTDGAAIRSSNPGFASASGPAMWRPSSASVVNQGTLVPVWSDFFLEPRAGTYDLGAVNPASP